MIAPKEIQAVQEVVRDLQARGRAEQARALEKLLWLATSALSVQRAGKPREYLTTGQAADALGVSRQTIKNWVDAGQLPGVRLGGRTLIHRDTVLEQIDKLQEARPPKRARTPEELEAGRAWREMLLAGLPADRAARLEALHQKMEDGEQLSPQERAEMLAVEREITDAAARHLENWIRRSRSTQA